MNAKEIYTKTKINRMRMQTGVFKEIKKRNEKKRKRQHRSIEAYNTEYTLHDEKNEK